jgi:hypothetical protein
MNLLMYWLGALGLFLLLLMELRQRSLGFRKRFERRLQDRKMSNLDWKLIDNSFKSDRPRRDCEREESLGVCTGRECLVYDTCDFNIKKVVH